MKTALMFLFILLFSGSAIAQDLPPEILADQYLLEARKALEKGDTSAAFQAFGKIQALDTDPPPDFAFFYGKMLVENSASLDDLLKGQALLKEFVISAGRGSAHYTSALELLSEAGAKAEEMEAKAEAERQEAEHLAKFRDILPQMVRIEGGTFTMGCNPKQIECKREKTCCPWEIRPVCTYEEREALCYGWDPDAKRAGPGLKRADWPPHQVQVSSFELSKHLVSYELWNAVMEESRGGGCSQCPATAVSWNEIQQFLRKLNAGSGRYRLPSEAEWEYAARGGVQSRGYRYIGFNELPRERQTWANELGLYYMPKIGRSDVPPAWEFVLSEWVQDCRHPNYQGAPSEGRAWESEDCAERATRVAWYSPPDPEGRYSGDGQQARPYNRGRGGDPRESSLSRGFRLARSLP